MEKENFAIESFKNIQQLIVFVHHKAGALLVIYGFILTAFINFTKDIRIINPFDAIDTFSVVARILAFLNGSILIALLLYEIYFIIFKIIKPQMAKHYTKNEYSLFYFEHTSNMTREKYLEEFKNMPNENILDQILQQVYEVSIILNDKTIQLSQCMKYLYVCIVLLLTFIFLIRVA